MFWENYIRLCNSIDKSPNAVAAACGVKSSGTVTGWSNGAKPRQAILLAIADYFSVPVSELTGERQKEKPAHDVDERREVSDKDLMFALWGDTAEVSDADLEDVKRYAAFVAERKKKRE